MCTHTYVHTGYTWGTHMHRHAHEHACRYMLMHTHAHIHTYVHTHAHTYKHETNVDEHSTFSLHLHVLNASSLGRGNIFFSRASLFLSEEK